MPTEVVMPALGMAQEKGTLINWLKAEGASVKKGEPLMEIETDKAAVEIEAPASGILANVTASAGDEVPVGTRVAVILAPGERLEAAVVARSEPLKGPAAEGSARPSGPEAAGIASLAGKPGVIPASPAARRIAREKGVDLGTLKGAGPQGAILAEDVVRAVEARGAKQTPAPGRVLPLTAMRRVIAERMTHSKRTAPHFYLGMDVDMTEVNRQRTERKEKGEKAVPSINDFILWASAEALRDFPSLNSTLTEQGVQVFSDINIGFAVAVEDGLVVPVIRDADRLSLRELAQKSRELTEKAQHKKLFPSDYEGGTFTVSNLGMFGVDSFVAVINPPQCAILAVGRVAPRAVARGEEIAVRAMMTMTLSADHRIVDGVVGARFLQKIKATLEKRL